MLANVNEEWVAKNPKKFQELIDFERTLPKKRKGIMNQLVGLSTFDVTERLHEIKKPTLVIHGEKDRLVAFKYGKGLSQGISNSILKALPNGGHMFWVTDFEETVQTVNSFLSDKSKL